MIKMIISCSLFVIIPPLTSCVSTATVVGTSYVPIHYTYAPGYNPPQVLYPDVPTDIDTYKSVVIIHK
ncbi:hypothetical protein Lgra_0783 [Legionella gratiana]|uniref:Lipoprotein n=1 Tax=Legionella gratiana TaxID=45066 RepID=A0A378JGC8_9GAMM|nr:hypothetical protein Lgra_0783 [Legionella gratiana]STX46041.1 Uncharacterised protein [Legionella gratiana]